MTHQAWALVASILLAFAGYLATYANNRLLTRRRERLELVNKRLNDFYGPLYIATTVGSTAYDALVQKLKRENDPNLRNPLTEKEYAEWRIWVSNVFMPLNEQCERILLAHAYLMVEHEVPTCILEFVTHVAAYRAVVAKWAAGDYGEWDSIIDYPESLHEYAKSMYIDLKTEQLSLIGKLHRPIGTRSLTWGAGDAER